MEKECSAVSRMKVRLLDGINGWKVVPSFEMGTGRQGQGLIVS